MFVFSKQRTGGYLRERGATLGYGVSGAMGATGMTTTVTNTARQTVNVATKAAGITSSMLNSGTVNIAMSAMSGGGWDGAWKAGVVGLATIGREVKTHFQK